MHDADALFFTELRLAHKKKGWLPLFALILTNGVLGNLACIRLHTYAVPGRTQAYLFIGLSRRVLLENRASGTLDSRKLRSMKRAGVIIPGPVLLPLAPAVLLTPL